jgi:WD40 repeat protein
MTQTAIYPGSVLRDRYRVLRPLGHGGFGQTFEVEDGRDRKVLKVLNLGRFQNRDSMKKAIDLFRREAAVLSRLHHSGIPRVEPDGYFTWPEGQRNALHCLVMEKIEGQNLQQWLGTQSETAISEARAIAWLKRLVEILAQVHQRDLIHRDIKPANIMLNPKGELVLVDFGAVRELTDTYLQRQAQNVTGTVIIAAGYTPPEQAEGQAVPQSDFFALGRTFVFLLTGKHPINFDRDPRTGKLKWRESAPQISQPLANLIDYMMDPFPGKRPQTTEMILRCLEEIVSPPPPPPPLPIFQEGELAPDATTTESGTSTTGRKRKSIPNLLRQLIPALSAPHPWQNAKLRRTLAGHADDVRAVAISPDGCLLASGSYDHTIKVWDLRTGKVLHTLTGHASRVTCIAISPDSQILASGSYDQTARLWALDTGELLQTLPGRAGKLLDVTFNPNGQTLLSSDLTIKIWAVRTGKLVGTCGERSRSAQLAAFSPDGRTCIVSTLDGTLELWNPHTGKLLRTFSQQPGRITGIACSPDGQTLARSSSAGIELWDLNTGKQQALLSSPAGGMTCLTFSPDSQTLAGGSSVGIELWHPRAGKRLCTLRGHAQTIRAVAFSPNGQILVSGSQDRTIKIWQAAEVR